MKENISLELLRNKSEYEIQGLYMFKGSCQSFWSLKAKVELSIFQDHTEKGETNQ